MDEIRKTLSQHTHFEFLKIDDCSELIATNSDLLPGDSTKYSDKRKREIITGRICARRAIQRIMPNSNFKIPIGEDRGPVWPKGIVGSISHNKQWSCAVVSDKLKGIGVDVERIIDPERLNRIGSRFITESEFNNLDINPLSATIIFSAKEALFKALYPTVQLYFGFMDANVTKIEEGKFTIKVLRKDPEFQPFQNLIEGHFLEFEETLITLIEIPGSCHNI